MLINLLCFRTYYKTGKYLSYIICKIYYLFSVFRKGVNDAELVPSKIANVKIPQMVISFYEARLTWSTVSGKNYFLSASKISVCLVEGLGMDFSIEKVYQSP